MERNDTGNEAVARVLRTYRERAGLSQNALAHSVRLHTSTVWKIETGKRSPGLRTINRLALRLGPSFKAEAEKAMADGH